MFPLDPSLTNVMCATCLRRATHYVVSVAIHGELLAMCKRHAVLNTEDD